MKILYLTLKKKWFDMILSGEKKEEYREIKPYWDKRLIVNNYTHVQFRNGYGCDSPLVVVELLDIYKNIGHPDLGAPDKKVYILRLGEIVSKQNVVN